MGKQSQQFCVKDHCLLPRAYHGHSKPLSGLSTYKSRQEKIPGSFKPNPNAMIVSMRVVCKTWNVEWNGTMEWNGMPPLYCVVSH